MFRRKLIFLFFRVSKDLCIRASYGNPQRSQFSLYGCLKVRKTAKIRKRYNQVPHLTQGTTLESNENTINIHKHVLYVYISSTMAAILMTSLLGPDAELRWANWFKLFHMTQRLFWYRSPKIVTKFTRDAHST